MVLKPRKLKYCKPEIKNNEVINYSIMVYSVYMDLVNNLYKEIKDPNNIITYAKYLSKINKIRDLFYYYLSTTGLTNKESSLILNKGIGYVGSNVRNGKLVLLNTNRIKVNHLSISTIQKARIEKSIIPLNKKLILSEINKLEKLKVTLDRVLSKI